MEFLRSFLRRHLAGKTVVASPLSSHYPIMALGDQIFNVSHVHTTLGNFVHLHFFFLTCTNRSTFRTHRNQLNRSPKLCSYYLFQTALKSGLGPCLNVFEMVTELALECD